MVNFGFVSEKLECHQRKAAPIESLVLLGYTSPERERTHLALNWMRAIYRDPSKITSPFGLNNEISRTRAADE